MPSLIVELLVVAFFSWSIVISTYVLYLVLVLRTSKKERYLDAIHRSLSTPADPKELPPVTILIPAHNEEHNIARKLENIAEYDYSREKIEVILLDDFSTDKTCEIASECFARLKMNGRIKHNDRRMGVNTTYNTWIQTVQTDFVLLTDADVVTERDALKKAMVIMMSFDNVGGITARMLQENEESSVATHVEKGYRLFYDVMSTCESAVYSTFPGYGAFILLRKSDFTPIPDYRGSSDGNLSLNLIRNGKNYLYIPDIIFYERTAGSIMEQRKQKVRRASRLIQSIFMHRDLLFNRDRQKFGTTIFPLRFTMTVISPPLFFAGLAAFILLLTLSNPLLLAPLFLTSFLLCFGIKYRNLSSIFRSFLFHQFYLVLGLLLSYRKFAVWQQINR